jgi:hypothetical protein
VGICSSFSLPAFIAEFAASYLIFTIGFKGGLCLGIANQCTPPLINLALLGIVIGFLQPFIHYVVLKKTTSLDHVNAAVIAAQYGSISIVTFITALTYLNQNNVPYDTFMSAIAGIMEIPALFSGLWLLKKDSADNKQSFLVSLVIITKKIVLCRKIMLIFLGFFVGLLLRNVQTGLISSIIVWPFSGLLIVFMIDIGIKIAWQRSYLNQISPSLIAFGIYAPIINGICGLIVARLMAVHIGTQLLFALLMASASYIAVPAIIGTQTKGAKEVIYLPLALAVTLPFNILLGIPLFYYCAQLLN